MMKSWSMVMFSAGCFFRVLDLSLTGLDVDVDMDVDLDVDVDVGVDVDMDVDDLAGSFTAQVVSVFFLVVFSSCTNRFRRSFWDRSRSSNWRK